MSDELAKVLRRFEERLVHLETSAQQGLSHWKRFHLHNALNALARASNTKVQSGDPKSILGVLQIISSYF